MGDTTTDDFLDYERVRHVYRRCFRPENEFAGGTRATRTQVTGWLMRHTFSVPELTRCREDIIKMLLCVHRGFRVDEKGGGSVGMLVWRANDTLWTGDLADVEKLVALGIASGLLDFVVHDREKWAQLPGQMPYVRVLIPKTGVTVN